MTAIRTRTASFSFNAHTGDEEVTCRVCGEHDGEMVAPCKCEGANKFVHVNCLYTLMLQREGAEDWWKLCCPKCKQPYEGTDEEILHTCKIETSAAPLSANIPLEERTMMKMIELTNIPRNSLKSQKYRGLRDAVGSFELDDYLKEENDFNLEAEENIAEDEMPQLISDDNEDLMVGMTNMALDYHFKLEDYDRGCELLESVLELRDSLHGEDVKTLKILSHLSQGYQNAEKFDAQVEILERELELKIRLFGESHHLVLQTMNKLADVYGYLGEYENQWKMLEQAKPIIKLFSIKLEHAQVKFNLLQQDLEKKGFRKEQSTRAGPKRNGDALDMVRSSTFPLDSKANKDPKRNGGGSNVKRSSTVPLDPREFQPIPNN